MNSMNTKINLQQLARKVAMKKRISQKSAEAFLREFFDAIIQNVTADKIVKITGLGSFKIIEVLERESVNVNTGERITIPGHTKLSFTPDNALKETVNKPFADFQTVVINDGTNLEEMEKVPSDEVMQEASSSEEEVEDVENDIDTVSDPEPESEETSELESEETPESESEETPESESEETPEPESEEIPESESEETLETEPAPEPVSEVDSEAEPDAEVSSETEPVPVDASETAEPVSEVTPKIDSAPKHVLEGTPQAEALRRHHSSRHHSSKKVRAMTSAEKWALTLGIILLCVISYLMGYYKLFGPSSNDDVKVEVAAAEEEETESPPIEKESVEDSSSLSKDTVSAVPIVEEEPVAPTEVVERSQEEAIRPTLVLGKKYKITGTRKKYVIKRGDYLAKIAEDEYGVKEFAKYIIAHNHFSNPNNIPVGKEILLPELEEMK